MAYLLSLSLIKQSTQSIFAPKGKTRWRKINKRDGLSYLRKQLVGLITRQTEGTDSDQYAGGRGAISIMGLRAEWKREC